MTLPRLFLLPVLLSACGSTVDIDVDSLDVEAFEFGIASSSGATDEESGLTLHAYTAILSDRADLCTALGDTENGQLDELDDVLAVQVLGLSVTTDGFDTYDTNVPALKPIFNPEVGDSTVAIEVIERRAGETVFNMGTRNLVDLGAVSNSSMSISSRSIRNGEVRKLSLSFKANLDMDRSDPSTYDVDVTDDEVPDFTRVSTSIKGRISGAEGCDAL